MSSMIEAQAVEPMTTNSDWSLWLRQAAAILRLEIKKNFWGRRALLLYLLAAAPVVLFAVMAFVPEVAHEIRTSGKSEMIFASTYGYLMQSTTIFFGCAWIFMNLFRGEVVDKSLHYYFLAALRREVLVAGKYAAGLCASVVLFAGSTIGALFFYWLARGHFAYLDRLFEGPKLGNALTYVGVTVLACVGYGAVFLVIGLFFRNPIIPGLLVYGWEWLNFLLPPVLKKISIIHYLKTLAPVPVSEGPLATIVDPTPAWIAIPSLLVFTALVLALAGWRIRKMEINYGGE